VQSIPTVIAVIGGQPLPLFQGAMPEPQVRDVIEKVLQAAATVLPEGAVAASPGEDLPAVPPRDPKFEVIEADIEAGRWDQALEGYRALLRANPGDVVAQQGLLNVELMQRTDGMDFDAVLALVGATPDEQMQIADAEFLLGRYDAAFQRLVNLVRAETGEQRAAARERLLALFDIVGPTDPAVVAGRTALSNALF
jgi:putative thioredoxin